MIDFQKYFVFFLIITFTAASCKKEVITNTKICSMENPGTTHPKASDYNTVLNDYVKKGLPGIIALVRDSNGLYIGSAGMADIQNGIKMEPCHVSKVASITKMMLSTAILNEVAKGTLSLEDPIRNYLPAEVVSKVKNVNDVTIRQLLNHSSGIADVVADQGFYLSLLDNPQKCWTADELVQFVYDDEPFFNPGGGVKYSNSNFLLASMIIEKATGLNHAELIKNYVTLPCGMNDTYYQCHDELPSNVAQGYYDLYNNGTILNLSNYNTGSGNGYGGMFSTVSNLQLLVEALFRDKTLLDTFMLKQMLTFTEEEPNAHRAMGLGVFKDFLDRKADEYAYGHRGRDLAYSADAFYFPEKDMTLCFIVNYGTNGETALKNVFIEFRKAIVDAMMKE